MVSEAFSARDTYSGDCDELVTPGVFEKVINADAVNGPGSYGYMFVLEYDRADLKNITQVMFPYIDGKIKTRYRYNGTWSDWATIQ